MGRLLGATAMFARGTPARQGRVPIAPAVPRRWMVGEGCGTVPFRPAHRPMGAPVSTTQPLATAERTDLDAFRLTPQQVRFFETFGFLRIPGLFRDDMARITKGFEDVFAQHETWDTNVELHFDQKRSIVPQFITKSDDLVWLLDDPRVVE